MDPSEVVRVGQTQAVISRMGVGLAPLIGFAGTVDDPTADAIIAHARVLGLRYVDVAPLYGLGRSEAALRRDSERHGDSPLSISTKAGTLLRRRTISKSCAPARQ